MNQTVQELLVQNQLDALLLWEESEIFWATGFPGGNGCAVIRRDGTILILPAGTQPDVPGVTLYTYKKFGFPSPVNPHRQIREHLLTALHGCKRIGICTSKLSMQVYFPLPENVLVDMTAPVIQAMQCKPDSFMPVYRSAGALNDSAFENIQKKLRPGMTEFELRDIVQQTYREKTGLLLPSGGDYLSGTRTLEIGGPPTGRKIEAGEAVIVDLQVDYCGASADTTRTFFCGEPDAARRTAYETLVWIFQEAETRLLKPGVLCCEVAEGLNSLYTQKGYPPLPHHAGHGVGYRRYEGPYFIPEDATPLRPGMLMALEPGIYTDTFGIRLENNYRITETGCERLTASPLDFDWAVTGTPV